MKPGFYVPESSVIHKAVNEDFVYIYEDEKAKLTKVDILGGNNNYLSIKGDDIKDGVRVLIINDQNKQTISTWS